VILRLSALFLYARDSQRRWKFRNDKSEREAIKHLPLMKLISNEALIVNAVGVASPYCYSYN